MRAQICVYTCALLLAGVHGYTGWFSDNVKLKSKEHEGFDDNEPELQEILPPEYQGDPDSIFDDLYNQLEVEKDYYEFKRIVDNYFKDGVLLLKVSYVGKTLGEDNIM